MKNQIKKSAVAMLTIGFVFVLVILSVRDAAAQGKVIILFDLIKETGTENEVKVLAQFAQNLDDFLKQADSLTKKKQATETEIRSLETAARRVKDVTSSTRSNLQRFISKLKAKNRWNDQLDAEVASGMGDGSVRTFFKRHGARKIFTEAETAFNTLNRDIDEILSFINRSITPVSFSGFESLPSINNTNEVFFMTTSFASPTAKKVKLKCVLLGIAIFGAELVKANLTAENLDQVFDRDCGPSATPTT